MSTTIITVNSVTYSLKARKLLSRAGIRSKLVKVDIATSSGGCMYGLEFDSNLFYSVVKVLRENGIGYSLYSGGKDDIFR